MIRREERLSPRRSPEDSSEEQIRRLERLGLVNSGVFLAGLVSFVLSFPLTLPPFRLAVLGLLAACIGSGLWLRRRFWTALDRELRRRKEAEQEARAADRAKGERLSHVSHEIRTPMNGVVGMTELLLSGELTPVQREQVEVIGKSAGALLALVNDVLDLSRIEARHMLLRPRDFSFRTMAEDVLRLLAPKAAEREVELRLQIDPALPADPERLRQVLLNLVGNGVRFTRKGSVTVTVEPLERTVPVIRCEVRDTGGGIRPEVQARLFQPFTQSKTMGSGTGLGLVISKNIVELMGGEIGFHSMRGVGSTFPAARPSSARQISPGSPASSPGWPARASWTPARSGWPRWSRNTGRSPGGSRPERPSPPTPLPPALTPTRERGNRPSYSCSSLWAAAPSPGRA